MPNIRLRNTVFAALLATVAVAHASPVPDYPFVHVRGSAFQAIGPDIGSLDFEIVATDADPAAARTVVETRVGEVRDLMRQLGMEADDAAVREIRQAIRKEARAADGGPVYELRCEVHVNVRNLANWAPLAGGLLGKPNLDGFASSFDRSDMDKINDELMTEAIQDARHRADVMAAGFGRRVGGVMAATPDALKNLGAAMGLERAEFRYTRGADKAGTQDVDRERLLMIPALKLQQPVDVIFRLEGASRRTR